jgi:magnesium transporter
VQQLLASLHPAEIGDLIQSLPHGPREILWGLVDAEDKGEVLIEVNDDVRAGLIEKMATDQLLAITEGLHTDDLADLLQNLPAALTQELLHSMDKQIGQRLESVLSYPEDTAGGLMDLDIATVRANVTLDVVLRYLRLRGEVPEFTDNMIVVDRFDRYQGLLSLATLLTSDPDASVAELMDSSVAGILASTTDDVVARLFEDRDLVSAPVVDEAGRLLGRITIDDVVDVIREEADHSLMSMAGLDEENDMFVPAVLSARRPAVWPGINLATAFLASWVIGL